MCYIDLCYNCEKYYYVIDYCTTLGCDLLTVLYFICFIIMEIDLISLEAKLKNRINFERAVSPIQLSVIFAQLFTVFAIMMIVFFLIPFFWVAITDDIYASVNYSTRFNAKMGGGMAAFFGVLALICFLVGRNGREKVLGRLYQAYLTNPRVYAVQVLLRRENAVLCAFAHDFEQQVAIETILSHSFKINPDVRNLAYGQIASVYRKHKSMKMGSFKKKLYKYISGLENFNFYFNSFEWPVEQGEVLYFLNLDVGLIPFYMGYRRIEYEFLKQLVEESESYK